jgi:hypothetical protein
MRISGVMRSDTLCKHSQTTNYSNGLNEHLSKIAAHIYKVKHQI